MPKVLSARKVAEGWTIKVDRSVKDAKLMVCDTDGAALKTIKVTGSKALMPQQKGTYVKLFEGKYLLDAVELRP